MRAPRGVRAATASIGLVVLVSGCTAAPEPSPGPDGAPVPASAGPSPSAAPAETIGDGVDPADLSRQVLDSSVRPADAPTLASQTVEVPTGLTADGTTQVTVQVRAVERRDHSTLLTLAVSAADPGTELAPDVFGGARNLEKFDSIALEDPAAGRRYLPLSWRRWISAPDDLELDGPTNDCVCPDRKAVLGPEPVLMDVMYGPLPGDVTTVSVTSPDGLLAITDVPVG
ncbi:hypothetical protein [Aquipuribacter sp. MA13-6]|uniref:hypothetical protein n=1 Tax=unclassified Aquipuribacter TaxID=2635084 RepID=UPI003EEDD121